MEQILGAELLLLPGTDGSSVTFVEESFGCRGGQAGNARDTGHGKGEEISLTWLCVQHGHFGPKGLLQYCN